VLPDGVFARVNGAVEFVTLPRPLPTKCWRCWFASSRAWSGSCDRGSGPCTQGCTCTPKNDRQGLEHLCGYGARPPFSQQRLTALPDGRLAWQLKRPLGDGRTALLLQPTELLRRLATLVPPPRAHLVRYHGVFAPAARWRREVIPAPAPEPAPPAVAETPQPIPRLADHHDKRSSRIPWAELLRRVFREDVLSCPCGGRRVVLAYVTQSKAVKAILDHLGLASTGPPLSPARSAGFAEATWQDDVPTLQQSSR
jgi:hypothetical protein